MTDDLNLKRARFVYEAARLEAEVSGRRIVPESWEDREDDFKEQFVKVVEKQCSDEKFEGPEQAHDSWWQKYIDMGWQYGPERSVEKRTHPDMVPFHELPADEREKDEIFLRLCYVAEAMQNAGSDG